MSQPIVLAGKLRRPDAAGMVRSRLVAPLLDGPPGGLDLIIAPPGSGKTTLMARIAAECRLPIAWYRVTTDDSTEAAVTAHLGTSVRSALGIPAAVDTSMDALLAVLESQDDLEALVVVDDLHEIADTPAEAAIGRFIELRPTTVRMLVGSRRQPGINIPRLRVSGMLREITSDDLRFRTWEVEELFTGFFREPLLPEAAAALTRRTGGWAAGLQLFHLATAGRSSAERAQAVTDLGGRSKLVRSYLARNVLDVIGDERRQFLLRTCTLGVLNASLCDELLETTGSARILDELEQRQLFTSSADDGQTFRYHEVLRTHLELALVEEGGAAGARSWYARSATLLERAGHLHEAARAFAAAEDWSSVARLIKQDRPHSGGAGANLLLPAAVVRHDPWLALVDARRRVREGSLTAADEAFAHASSLLDEPTFRDRCTAEGAVARLWLPADVRGGRDRDPDHWSTPVRRSLRGMDPALMPSAVGRSARALSHGLVALLNGDLRLGTQVLREAHATGSEDPAVAACTELASAVADLVTGGDSEPATRLTEIARNAAAEGLPWIARLAHGLAECVLIAVGAPQWRVAASEALPDECDRLGDPWGAALLRLAVAVAEHVSGSGDPAPGYADAAARLDALDAPVLQIWALTLGGIHRAVSSGAPQVSRVAADRAAQAGVPGAAALASIAEAVLAAGLAGAGGSVASVLDSLPGGRSSSLRPAAIALLDSSDRAEVGRSNGAEPGPVLPSQRTPVEPRTTGAAAPSALRSDLFAVVEPALDATGAVTVVCFGGFRIAIGGRPIGLDELRPRARSLLRLLAVSAPDAVHRERLVEALWPDADLAAGTRRLQVAISSIRRLLQDAGIPGEIIVRSGDAYRLSLPLGSTVDVRAFEAAVRDASSAATRGDLATAIAGHRRALDLYGGDLLPEEGPADYLTATRERLRVAAAGAAAAAAHESRQLGELGEAISAARRSVDIDPFQDSAWDLLTALHTDAGDHLAATQARRDHSRAIAEMESVDA